MNTGRRLIRKLIMEALKEQSDKLDSKSDEKKKPDQKEKESDTETYIAADDAEEITFEYDSLDRNTARTVIKKAYEHFIKVKKKQKDPKYKDLIRDLDRKAKGYRALSLDDTKGGIYSEFLGSKVREEMLDYFDDNPKAAAKYLKVRGKQYDLNDAFVSYTDFLRKKFSDKSKESNYGDDENQDYSREKYLKESKSHGLSRGSLYRMRYRRY